MLSVLHLHLEPKTFEMLNDAKSVVIVILVFIVGM